MTDPDLAEFDIPVTEDFVRGVQRGVRRRRLRRAAATGGATLAVAGAIIGGFALAQGGSPPPVAAPSSAAATSEALDGYVITRLPAGLARVGDDSFYTARSTDQGLVNDGTGPAPGDPAVSVTMRRYQRAGGAGFFVTVMRPLHGDAAAVSAQLLTGVAAGATPAATFDTKIGTARLFSETTTYRVAVTTADHVVISIESHGTVQAAEIQDLARAIDKR